MAHSKIVFRAAAREKILSGATQLADAVRVTLGPKSKSVLIQNSWGNPTVCNDGVTIAKRIDLLDPEENLGAQMLRQAAERTGDAVGDGTSTSTVLAHAMLTDGIRNVVAGASAVDLKRGLDCGLALVVESLAALMDVLKAAGKWSRTKHSRATRKAINSMISQKAMIVSEFDDPVTLYLEKLKEIAQGKITNPVKAAKSPARAATEIKRVELEVAEGMELEVEDLEPSAETGSIFDPSEGLQESERKLDQSTPEATPNKTATIIPYPMPDLNKIIKGF